MGTTENCGKPVVLYGMGDGADKVLAAFDRYGIKASAVIASDDFVRGQKFHDFTVKKLSAVETEFGDIIIALCFASQLPDVMEHITKISEKHETLVPSVPVFGNKLFDNDFITENKEQIESAYSLLADDLSKKVYENILKFYYTGRIDLLPPVTTDKDEAFGNILNLGENESYVDLGAYNGDTIDEFLHYTNGSYKRIIAFEPNAKNFEKLKLHCKGMANVSLWQLGSYSKTRSLYSTTRPVATAQLPTRALQQRLRQSIRFSAEWRQDTLKPMLRGRILKPLSVCRKQWKTANQS